MIRKFRKTVAFLLSLCMILGAAQLPAGFVYAETADGEIDTSESGWETVRYCTNAEITSSQTENGRLSDFFADTETMSWSVEFKTTNNTNLSPLLALNSSGQYYVLYVRGGLLSFESRGGLSVSSSSITYADGEWHTAKLEMTKNSGTILYFDGTKVGESASTACIKDLTWTPGNFVIGGMDGYGSASGWVFSGSIRNVVLQKKIPETAPDPVFRKVNPLDAAIHTDVNNSFSSGSVNITYRMKEDAEGEIPLLSVGSLCEISLNTAADQVEVSSGDSNLEIEVENTALNTEKWHNLAMAWDNGEVKVFVDGELAGSGDFTASIDVSSLQCSADVYVSEVNLYDTALSEGQVATLHETTSSTLYPDGTKKMDGYLKTENRELFNSGYEGSNAYRIPAIVTSKKTGTVIASIDKRWNGWNDIGVIDSVIRRSEDNGKTWGDTIPVIALSGNYAYTVDPALLVDNDENSEHYGRIYMLVDMWRQGTGFGGALAGTGYVEVDGKQYLELTHTNGTKYTLRENGIVYDSNNQPTDYRVEMEATAPYTDMGELYKDGERIGNIYRNSELTFLNTCYLWLTYSDDDGITWSTPRDITPDVKSEWMKFCGTGPGMGIKTEEGRLIFPTYCTNAGGIQSSFNVYSDDNGETWHQGGSPNNGGDMETAKSHLTESCIVELENGHLLQFMRSYNGSVTTSVSEDEGLTWSTPVQQQGIRDVYCQMSAVHYPGKLYDPADGTEKEAIIFSNPGPDVYIYSPTQGREYGLVRIAFVNSDDTLDWAYKKLIEEKRYIYSSLTVMEDGNIGLVYEHESYAMIGAAFTSFSPEYIMDENTYENTPVPTAVTTKLFDADGEETENLSSGGKIEILVDFSQNVFAAGNVALEVQVGDASKEAVLVGNIDEDTLKFVYSIEDSDSGNVVVTGNVRVKEDGVAETIYNVSLTDKPCVLQEVTVGYILRSNSIFAELPVDGMSATAGSAYNGTAEGPASNVLDGNLNTYWHSNYNADNASNGGRPKHYVTIALGRPYLVSGLTYTPRQDSLNGTATRYQIEVSTDGNEFVPVSTGEWERTSSVKTAGFYGAALASHVRFRVLQTEDEWATAAEIRIIGTSDTDAATDKTELLTLLAKCDSYGDALYLINQAGTLESAMTKAKETAANLSASSSEINEAVTSLDSAFSAVTASLRESFQDAVGRGEQKSSENYNITTWLAYSAALEAAQSITEDSTDEEVFTAYLNLLTAEDNLAFSAIGNTALLEEVKELASEALSEELTADDYTEDSWQAYQNAYRKLEEAFESAISATTLKQYIKSFNEAKRALIETSGSNPGENNPPGTEPDKDPDDSSGTEPDKDPDDSSGTEPGKDPDDSPGTEPDKDPDNSSGANPGNTSGTTPGTNTNPDSGTGTLPQPDKPKLELGKTYQTSDQLMYKVTSVEKKTVSLVGTAKNKKKFTSLNVKASVTIEGVKCNVTEIGAKAFSNCTKLKKATIGANVTTIGKQAFSGCKNLKTIAVKGNSLKKVGAKALKGINKKAVIKVPKAKKKDYKKLFSKKGQASSVTIK